MSETVPEHPEDIDLVGSTLGWWSSSRTEDIPEEIRQQRFFAAIEALLRHHGGPAILMVEDVHWLDPASLELLTFLGRTTESLPFLIVTIARPGEMPRAWQGLPGRHELPLAELSPEAIRSYVSIILPGQVVDDEVLGLVAEQSRGNPLYAFEIVNHLRSVEGILQDSNTGRWYLNPRFDQTLLPENVSDLILARIDSLPARSRQTLKVASVFGRTFELDMLTEVLPFELPDEELADELRALASLGLTVDEGVTPPIYAFAHILIQEVAYESLNFDQRRQIHLSIGDRLEERAGDHADEQAALLAHHFVSGRNEAKAYHFSRVAAFRSLSNYANEEARHHLSTAIDLCPKVETSALEPLATLYKRRSRVLQRLGLLHEAFRDAVARFNQEFHRGDLGGMSRGCYTLSRIAEADGRFDTALPLARSAKKLAERSDWEEGIRRSTSQIAGVHYRKGDGERALALFERLYRETPSDQVDGQMLLQYGLSLNRAQRVDDQLAVLAVALERARTQGDKSLESMVQLHRSNSLSSLGRPDEAREALELAERLSLELGDVVNRVNLMNNRAVLALRSGQFEQAESILKDTLHWAERIGATEIRALANSNLGMVLHQRGELDEALEHYQTAYELNSTLGSADALIALANIAEVQVTQNDPEAEKTLAELRSGSRRARALELWAFAGTTLGRLFQSTDRTKEAADVLTETIAFAEENGVPDLVAEARELLAD